MKTIECYNGELAMVDDEDYPLLSRHKWSYYGKEGKKYVSTTVSNREGKYKNLYMHVLIMGCAQTIDHIDFNTLNNQKSNLRKATRSENGWNRRKQVSINGKPPTSKYKGVSRYSNSKGETLWRVIIKTTPKGVKPEKYIRLHGFKTEEEAAMAYDVEIIKFRGEWATTNLLKNNNRLQA